MDIVTVTDKTGKVWVLSEIDLEDVADLEERLGPYDGWWTGSNQTRNFLTVLWGTMRKCGLSQADILDKKWTLKLEEVGRLFLPSQVPALTQSVVTLLRNSSVSAPIGIRDGVLSPIPLPPEKEESASKIVTG